MLLLSAATASNGACPSGPRLKISEVFYDPAGSDDSLEWVELYNTGPETIMLDGHYSLGWGGSDYTYGQLDLLGSIPPGTVFVVGGPTTSAVNGSPTLDMAVNFSPVTLQNAGATADGIALFDRPVAAVNGATVPIDSVIYGDTNDSGLLDATGAVGTPDVGDAPSGSSLVRDEMGWSIVGTPTPNATALPPPTPNLILSEVMYDPVGADDNLEWIELFNQGASPIVLDGNYSLGWGGSDYTYGVVDLTGTVQPGESWVIGGPVSDGNNGAPYFDQAVLLAPTVQNAGVTADGVALFAGPASGISSSSIPLDAVIYGGSNDSGLIDPSGTAPAPHVSDAASGQSIEREPGGWVIASSPTPNSSPMSVVACFAFGNGFEGVAP